MPVKRHAGEDAGVAAAESVNGWTRGRGTRRGQALALWAKATVSALAFTPMRWEPGVLWSGRRAA